MNKSSNGKKSKVPKLTEAEYAAYISSLKDGEEGSPAPQSAVAKAEPRTEKVEG